MDTPFLSKGHSFKDALNRKSYIAMLTHPPIVYIVEKSREVQVLEATKKIISDLFSYYTLQGKHLVVEVFAEVFTVTRFGKICKNSSTTTSTIQSGGFSGCSI
jgi:hypothetical protein